MDKKDEPTLGLIKNKTQQDIFGFQFSPDKKSFLLGWQSTPSALTRAMPIILMLIFAFLVLANLEKGLIIFTFIALCLIGILTFFIVIFKTDSVVIADTSSSSIGDKISGDVVEGEIDYQPEVRRALPKRIQSRKK